jgi:hypothetical protein
MIPREMQDWHFRLQAVPGGLRITASAPGPVEPAVWIDRTNWDQAAPASGLELVDERERGPEHTSEKSRTGIFLTSIAIGFQRYPVL